MCRDAIVGRVFGPSFFTFFVNDMYVQGLHGNDNPVCRVTYKMAKVNDYA